MERSRTSAFCKDSTVQSLWNLYRRGAVINKVTCSIEQQFSSSVQQEILKHAIPDYLLRATDLFTLRLSNKKMTIANTIITIWCECPVLDHNL